MPVDVLPPDDPVEWLRYAESDLIVASQSARPGVLPATLCFHAQQAAEKCLKAVLLKHGVAFPYTHSVSALIGLVVAAGIAWPPGLDDAATLTDYAVAARYPSAHEAVDDEERARAVTLARRVLEWATAKVAGP
jgi:HEPN domain-containing protein